MLTPAGRGVSWLLSNLLEREERSWQEISGTKAMMVVGRHGMGWQVFGQPYQRKPVVIEQSYGRWSDEPHRDDFCDAIRTDRLSNAPGNVTLSDCNGKPLRKVHVRRRTSPSSA